MYPERQTYPPARHFDATNERGVFTDNPLPYDISEVFDFMNAQNKRGWRTDLGKKMVVFYQETDKSDHGAIVRFTWQKERGVATLDIIPRRTETMDFARRYIDEPVHNQIKNFTITRAGFGSDRTTYVTFESTAESSAGIRNRMITLDLNTGTVNKEESYTPKPKK